MKLPINRVTKCVEPPEMYLCNTDKSIIGGMNVVNANLAIKFNTYSELSFEFDRTYIDYTTGEEKVNYLYDLCEALRVVYLVGYGYFQIQSTNINTNGVREYKECECYSLEYELASRYLQNFIINTGEDGSIDGVQLYDTSNHSRSLLHMILEKFPDWDIGHVDYKLENKERSFNIDEITVLDFLMNDMSEAFKCVVTFNTDKKLIEVFDEESAGKDTSIYLSMDTIATNAEVSFSADDIKTVLYLEGADELDAREVNLGVPYILDLSYYNTVSWLGESLYLAFNAYQRKVERKREDYKKIMKEWNALYDECSALYNTIPDYEIDDSNVDKTVYSIEDRPVASQYWVNKICKVVATDFTYYYICKSHENEDNASISYEWKLDIDFVNSFYNFPEPSIEYVGGVYKVYNTDNTGGDLYYKCEAYKKVDGTTGYHFILAKSDYGIYILREKQAIYEDIKQVQVDAGFGERPSGFDEKKPDSELTMDEKNYKRYLTNFRKLDKITDELQIKEEAAKELESQMQSLVDEITDIAKDISIDNVENFTPEQRIRLNPFLREDSYTNENILVTEYDTEKEIFNAKEELLEDGYKELSKISQPQLSFTMNMSNILALEEFEPIWDCFDVGNYVHIEIRPDYVRKTQILEIDINFDDLSDFTVIFGNLKSLYSEIDKHADLMSQAISAGRSVASNANKWDNNVNKTNRIHDIMQNGLDNTIALKSSSNNQAITFDQRGIHLRKWTDSNMSDYEKNQIWMNNDQIAFTDDGWESAKMAIGRVLDTNLIDDDLNPNGSAYGIIAPNIVGTLLAGENLVIESTKQNGGISTFRVDKNGARLYNSTFIMKQDEGGAIILDPDCGIAAGDSTFNFTINENDGTVSIPKNSMGFPENASFFLDIKTGDALFKGTIYASGDSYFEGNVNATDSILRGTIYSANGEIGGWTIEDGYLHSGKNKSYVSLSSAKYKTGLDSDGNIINEPTDYAIWAGAENPASAPFWVKRDGSIYAKNGTFAGTLEAAKGTFAGDISAATGTFGSQINVGDNFIVDANGNVSVNGNINLSSGNITWGNNDPTIGFESYSDSDVNAYLKNRYKITSTTIGQATIESPEIVGNDISAYGAFQALDGGGNLCGFYGSAYGLDAKGKETRGVALSYYGTSLDSYGRISANSNGYYIIVTDGGVRLQAPNHKLVLTDNGGFYDDIPIGGSIAVFG